MYDFVKGPLVQLSPTHATIEAGGVGYHLQISLQTYEQIEGKKEVLLWSHLVVKEDAHTLYGFAGPSEREMFRRLIQVNGIGASTARMMLSSLNEHELASAIASGNTGLLKSIKGIGPKAAQRIIVELQEKMQKSGIAEIEGISAEGGSARQEALEALLALGFPSAQAQKVVSKVSQELGGNATVEAILKNSLKLL
jgi:Holliday junction DNA helicase RuvA